MDYQEFGEFLGTWGPSLKKFIESPSCDGIYDHLRNRSSQGRIVLPAWQNTFRAFRETPKDKLKCVFFLQDPYPWRKGDLDVADGIALSCSITKEEQPSLSLFFDGMEEDLKIKGPRNPDLSYLCRQGVMMLNTALTVELNRPNSHSMVRVLDKKIRLWEPFMKYFCEEVLKEHNGLPLVFCGKESQYYARYVNPLQHYIIKTEHPAAAAHAERKWKHEKVFSKVNFIVKHSDHQQIDWK